MKIDLSNLPAADAAIDDEVAWGVLREAFPVPPGATYLNHGSFGLPPRSVVEAQCRIVMETTENPMAMFLDRYDAAHIAVRDRLADFVGADRHNLVLVDNATYAMNVIAAGFPLAPDDEVLMTDHCYGAVAMTWRRACRRAGANLVTVRIPLPVESHDEIADAIIGGMTDRTRLLVFSHVTSPTALNFPAEEICRRAAERGVRTCVDGPHALATMPLKLDALGCDFYTASCHKWLSGPIGTGFLYARPEVQHYVEPLVVSWGRVEPSTPESWQDWFVWIGTRDPAATLSLPVAIDFLEAVGFERFRERTHYLAREARRRLLELPGAAAISPDSEGWYGPMVAVALERSDAMALKSRLRKHHRFETAVSPFEGQSLVRVSCHLYNSLTDVERFVAAVEEEIA